MFKWAREPANKEWLQGYFFGVTSVIVAALVFSYVMAMGWFNG